MTTEGNVIQFVPRPNPNRELNALEIAAIAIVGQITEPADTAPCEYCADEKDPA